MSLPATSSALSSAAPLMIAVPCWSSWKTGMSIVGWQALLDLEALRAPDVLEVDAAEGGLERLDDPHHVVRFGGVDLDVEHVDVGEPLEQQRLALHHRLAGERADVAQAEHGRAVGDDRHQVPAGGVAERLQRVLWISRTGSATPGV